MMNSEERITMIKDRLNQSLSPASIDIIDDSHKHAGHASAKGGGHFTITVVAQEFEGKSLIQRHRMVYDAIGDGMKSEIHALSIKAKTPEEN
jgi:BolA protein